MKRTPLTRRTPLKSSGGLARKPMKRKAKPKAPKVEALHMALVATMPCLVRGCGGRSTVHHVTASIFGGRIARSNKRVVPLCPRHHQIQHGPRESVEALSHKGFYREYGIDLLAVADRLWREYEMRIV